MNEVEIIRLIAQITETQEGGISMETTLEELGWDSLVTLTFLAKAEQVLGFIVDADRLSAVKTVRDISNLISNV